jgi:GNAT superfamily N-acetyltransferase
MAKIKVRRINREELPGAAILRDAVAADLAAFPSNRGVLDLDMDIDPNLRHLLKHDPDGFFSAYQGEETLGFAASHVRSRQWILSELWVLPQHQGHGAGDALLSRVLAYGERSGAREFLAVVPTEPAIQTTLLGHGFEPLMPVYLFSISDEAAARLASTLTRLLPGKDVTNDLLSRRGQADLDRIDRVTRNVTRDVDHGFWLKERQLRAAFVRQGERIAAYAYGGRDQVGPVAGSTQEAAVSALGWALTAAIDAGTSGDLELRVPAHFKPAVKVLLDSGARLQATLLLCGKGLSLSFDRCIFGPLCLP